jgi:hypothetical protein
MNNISICTVIKNESRYLEEWIIYHKLIGFEHFYIYDNNSTDNLAPILEKYKEIITYTKWPLTDWQQKLAYQDYVQKYRRESVWTAFIDVDEFIIYKNRKPLKDYLRNEFIDAFILPWFIFGTNNHKKIPSGLVLENYLLRHNSYMNQYKTLIRNDEINEEAIVSPHRIPTYLKIWERFADVRCFYINHYILKSEEDLCEKITKGAVWNAELSQRRLNNIKKTIQAYLDKYNIDAVVYDNYMLKYADQIKKILLKN